MRAATPAKTADLSHFPQQGLMLAIGGDLAVPRPSWVTYAAQASLLGARPYFVGIRPGEGGVPDPGQLGSAVRQARADGRQICSVILTLPDNPTGTLAPAGTIRELCQVAAEHDLIIVSDEIYRDLVHDPAAPFTSPACYAPDRTIVTPALSTRLALGGGGIGAARLPDGTDPGAGGHLGQRLRSGLIGIGSEIWSAPAAPIQQAAAFAFSDPPELAERIALSRRLHRQVARAVGGRFAAAGAIVPPPQAAFYLYPDFGPVRDRLRGRHGVRTSDDLAALLLQRYGVGVLAGSAFGDDPGALRVRVATGLLYGETNRQRECALTSGTPLEVPWIAASLDRIAAVLADLTGVSADGAVELYPEARSATFRLRKRTYAGPEVSGPDGSPPGRTQASASSGSNSGRLGGTSSPDERPVSRRRTQGTAYSTAHRVSCWRAFIQARLRVDARRAPRARIRSRVTAELAADASAAATAAAPAPGRGIWPGRGTSGSGSRQSAATGTPSVSQTNSATRRCPSAVRCSRSALHIRRSCSTPMLHRSTKSHWRAAAIVRRCMLYAATRPRTIRITGNAEGSNPVNSSTRQPVARRLATQSSNSPASRSGSVPGRRMSLPPAAMLIRSGAIWIARGACSSATSRSSLPRTAKLAYRRPGWCTASWPANRSAQPRNPSP